MEDNELKREIKLFEINSLIFDNEIVNKNKIENYYKPLSFYQSLDFTSIKNLAITKGFQNIEVRRLMYAKLTGINL